MAEGKGGERHWLGKGLLAAGSGAFTLGAAYFVTGTVATGAVLWGPLLIVAILLLEITQFSLLSTAQAGLRAIPLTVQLGWRKDTRTQRPQSEKGFLDFEKGYLEATTAATKTLGMFTAEMNVQNPKIVAQTAKTQATQGTSVETRLRVANETAALINRHAARFESLEKTYRKQCEGMSQNLVDMLSTASATGDLGEFPNILATAQQQTAGSRQSMAGYRDAVTKTRQMRVSQPLNQACDRLIAVLTRIIEDTDSNLKALADARQVISNRWPKPPRGGRSTSNKGGSRK